MIDERLSFESAVAADAGMIVDREPQAPDRAMIPAALALVSAGIAHENAMRVYRI